ncbi:MAG: bifunctional nuclease family protein [Bacteroidales bacterium]|nr:bifunctional nuclease family protein [Bacteroidales bacterium]MDD3665563.1 bifunctional nuclease family protein [Bacteroidales bacterium]
MKKIRLEVIGMSYSQLQSGAYALILGEADGRRRLPIIIGSFEAQSIALELEKMKPSRPLTHDLFKTFATTFDISITEVLIHKFSDGIFYALLHCTNGEQKAEIDSRTSDAVALALRFRCPVYTTEEVMTLAAIDMSEQNELLEIDGQDDENDAETYISEYDNYEIEELEKMMQQAIDNEDYEKASLLRDEIKRRSGA